MIDSVAGKLGGKLGIMKVVQFHTNYSYEDFIEGIVPDVEHGGFKYENGVFLNYPCPPCHILIASEIVQPY